MNVFLNVFEFLRSVFKKKCQFLKFSSRSNFSHFRCGNMQCSTSVPLAPDGTSHFDVFSAELMLTMFSGRSTSSEVLNSSTLSQYWCFSIGRRNFFAAADLEKAFQYVRDGTQCGNERFCNDRECLHISKIPGLTNCTL